MHASAASPPITFCRQLLGRHNSRSLIIINWTTLHYKYCKGYTDHVSSISLFHRRESIVFYAVYNYTHAIVRVWLEVIKECNTCDMNEKNNEE